MITYMRPKAAAHIGVCGRRPRLMSVCAAEGRGLCQLTLTVKQCFNIQECNHLCKSCSSALPLTVLFSYCVINIRFTNRSLLLTGLHRFNEASFNIQRCNHLCKSATEQLWNSA